MCKCLVNRMKSNKAFADSCSELYKVVGTDSLKAKPLKDLLKSKFGKIDADFTHASGRPFSALQLLECVESELGLTTRLSDAIRDIAKHRVDADHKVLITNSDKTNYGEDFDALCTQLTLAANALAKAVEARVVLRPKQI